MRQPNGPAGVQSTWNGFTMCFQTLRQARNWQCALTRLARTDMDAAQRVAYAGQEWRKAALREVTK